MTDWQPLAGSGVPRGARLKDRAVRWSWAAVGYALPGTALAEHCLRSGAEVPLGLVLPAAGPQLLGHVATAGISLRLHDWLDYHGRPAHVGRFFQLGGNWQPLLSPIDDSLVMREAEQLHAAGFRFADTVVYDQYVRRIAMGKPVLRGKVFLDSVDLIDAYFSRYVALFRSIETDGLQHHAVHDRLQPKPGGPQQREPQRVGLSSWRQRLAEWGEREIGVAIGENGDIHRLPGGQHRTAIARVLGLPRLPVQVRLVHAGWLARQPEPSPWLAIQRALQQAQRISE